MNVPDLAKLLAGERQEHPVEGAFCNADLRRESGLTESTAGRHIRQAVERGLIEFVGMLPRRSIDGISRRVAHYRMVAK